MINYYWLFSGEDTVFFAITKDNKIKELFPYQPGNPHKGKSIDTFIHESDIDEMECV